MYKTLKTLTLLTPLLLAAPALADSDRDDHGRRGHYSHYSNGHDDHSDRGRYHRNRHDDRGWRDRDRDRVSVVIRGPYASFFIGGDSRYVVRDRDTFRGYRVYDSRYERCPDYYHIGRKRFEPTDCRRVFFVMDKRRHRDAVYSELVCRDRWGDTSAVPGTRRFEHWLGHR